LDEEREHHGHLPSLVSCAQARQRSHERLPLLPIVEQGGSRFSKTEH